MQHQSEITPDASCQSLMNRSIMGDFKAKRLSVQQTITFDGLDSIDLSLQWECSYGGSLRSDPGCFGFGASQSGRTARQCLRLSKFFDTRALFFQKLGQARLPL